MTSWSEPDGPTPEQEAAWDYNTLRDHYELVVAHAEQAVEGIAEAVRILDLMGRGGDARVLAIYGNNLRSVLERGA